MTKLEVIGKLREIKPEWAEAFLKETVDEDGLASVRFLHFAISHAFSWDESVAGYYFWSDVYYELLEAKHDET